MSELGERLPPAPLSFSLSLCDYDWNRFDSGAHFIGFLVEGEDKLEPLSPFPLHKIIHR